MVDVNKEKAMAWLNEKWQHQRECRVCGKTSWILGEAMGEIREFGRGGDLLPVGRVVPLLVITCSNCGNSVLFNALVAGLLEPEKKDTLSTETPSQAATSTPGV